MKQQQQIKILENKMNPLYKAVKTEMPKMEAILKETFSDAKIDKVNQVNLVNNGVHFSVTYNAITKKFIIFVCEDSFFIEYKTYNVAKENVTKKIKSLSK
ncbi:hypothetical protein [Yersinia phage MHG19]|nr:hypothetical protein [Yersinia phage MHG19]